MNAREQPVGATFFGGPTYVHLILHDFTLDDNLPAVEPPVNDWTRSSTDLGVLEVLPLEIILGLASPTGSTLLDRFSTLKSTSCRDCQHYYSVQSYYHACTQRASW